MHKLKMFLVLGLALALTACSGCTTTGADGVKVATTQEQKVEFTCAASIMAMQAITAGVRAGKINATQQAAAVKAGEALLPICGRPGENPPTLGDAKVIVLNQAAAELAKIASGLGSTSGGSGGEP
jgi:hypothetical protein